ncbi:MAG: phosphomannomutase/phosphoglucomutase [Nanoarchaeota archaeon]
MSIFKAYDIRGIYQKELDEEIAYKVGKSYVQFTRAKKIVVGHDARLSSPSLCKALIRGLADQGADIIFAGMCTTPMLHFLSEKFDGGIIVTASHNPKEYNGFKMYGKKGLPINYDTGIKDIQGIFTKGYFKSVKKGSVTEKDLRSTYYDFVVKKAKADYAGLTIAVDVSNGAAGEAVKEICSRLGIRFLLINEKPDGNFPNHDPNPLKKESRVQLSKVVKEKGANLGVIIDPDEDRAIFLDEQGNDVSIDSVKILIGEKYLTEVPHAVFVFDIFTSKAVKEILEEKGGKVIFERVGYTFIFHTMLHNSAVFGAEASGHAFFKELDYCDSAIYAALKVLQMLKEKKKPISALAKEYEKYKITEICNYETEDKDSVLRRIEEEFSAGKITHLDGVSIDMGDVWFTMRPSNTDPVMRLRIEGKTEKRVHEIKSKVEKIILRQKSKNI